MDSKYYLGITFLGTFIHFIYGCSPEGWVEPTLESKAHYAKLIVIGKVTKIYPQDPANMVGETYGASVYVQCTYKGGILGDSIKIGGAGFIQGMCDSKDLVLNKRYILFLDEKQDGQDWYLQSGAAEDANRDSDLVKMCNLTMEYPRENGFTLPRKQCKEASTPKTCKRYEEPKVVAGRKPVIETQLGDAETTTPADGACSVIASLGLLVTSLILSSV